MLDFTPLTRIAYRGFETAEAQEQKDQLIEQGYIIVDDAEDPFLKASEKASDTLSALSFTDTTDAPKQALKRKTEAFMNASGTRNYKALYRAALDYHKRHSPPTVDSAYWQTHIAGENDPPEAELQYWEKAANDASATASAHDNDPFLIGLLLAVYDELEREYNALRRTERA